MLLLVRDLVSSVIPDVVSREHIILGMGLKVLKNLNFIKKNVWKLRASPLQRLVGYCCLVKYA
jgi:hypothetical protein